MTYARSRLWLGITGVGLSVLLACAVLATGAADRLLPTDPAVPLHVHALHVAGALGLHALLFLALDFVGGAVLVREKPPAGQWLATWVRGAGVLWVLGSSAAALVLAAGRGAGNGAALGAALLLGLAVAGSTRGLAGRVAALRSVATPEPVLAAARRAGLDPAQLDVVEANDATFTGGWSGLLRPRLVVPAGWAALLGPDELAAQLARRAAVRHTRTRGHLLALGWNAFGLATALSAPGAGAQTAAGLVTAMAWMLLWQFAGVLLLPSLSRGAVLEADATAAVRVGTEPTIRAITALDALQEDEATRPDGVETVFHPVPQLSTRTTRLQAKAAGDGLPSFYNATRVMLGTGLVFGGLLGRAVHCNIGRPALWAFYPGD